MSIAPMSRWRKEPILGYVPKNDEKKNLDHKVLKLMLKNLQFLNFNSLKSQMNFITNPNPQISKAMIPTPALTTKNDSYPDSDSPALNKMFRNFRTIQIQEAISFLPV